MKIVEILSGGAQNGAAVHCLLVSRELARRGHVVTIVCRPGAWISQAAGSAGIPVVESELNRWPPGELARVAALVREAGVDVLHTHMSRAHLFGILLKWKTGLPCVATAHARRLQLHWAFNDRVIAVSEATSRFHRRYNLVRASRIEIIPNFVDPRLSTRATEQARRDARIALGLEAESPVIGTVGELLPHKGLLYMIRALPQVMAASPDVRLLLVGGGPAQHRKRLRAEACRHGVLEDIVWTGHRTDVASLLPALDVFVKPSLDETLPISVLEAMAAGLPVVATDVGGTSECVRPDETGLLVPPRNPFALAGAISRLLADSRLRRRFGEAGRDRAQRHFSAEAQVPRIEAALFRAVAQRSGRLPRTV
jgi:glycosyltransferase involved in cell wall biosynthesis